MSDERPPATGGFIQFGDGEPIPVADISCDFVLSKTTSDIVRFDAFQLRDLEVTLPIPLDAAARILRAVGLPTEADRIEIAAHPDLAELDVQMDGYYGEGRAE